MKYFKSFLWKKKKKKLIFLKAYYISYKNCINTFLNG